MERTQESTVISPDIYTMIRGGMDFGVVKSKTLELINAHENKEESKKLKGFLEANFTEEKFNLLKKVAEKCTYDQFSVALKNGDFPTVELSKNDMELLKGGVPVSWQFAVTAACSVAADILSGFMLAAACISGCIGGAAACDGGNGIFLVNPGDGEDPRKEIEGLKDSSDGDDSKELEDKIQEMFKPIE